MSDAQTDAAHWDAVELATELLLEDQPSQALVELGNVLKADPTNAYAYHYTAVALVELRKLQAASEAYRAAVRLAPAYVAARLGLCHTLRELGELQDALAVAKDALKDFADDGEVHYAAAYAHLALGQTAPARRHLQRYVDSQPELESRLEAQALLDSLEPEAKPESPPRHEPS